MASKKDFSSHAKPDVGMAPSGGSVSDGNKSSERMTKRDREVEGDEVNHVMKLASMIVTPSRVPPAMSDNVTIREREVTKSLSFSSSLAR